MILGFIGLSSCGKTTISRILEGKEIPFNKKLLNELKEIGLFKKPITCTSRIPRKDEQEGIDYYFLSKNQFIKDIKDKKFVEYTQVYNNYYGLKYEEFNKYSEKDNLILIMEPNGIEALKKKTNKRIITFFLDISLNTLEDRMNNKRNESIEEIENRKKDIEYIIDYKNKCDYIIDTNKSLDLVLNEIINIIKENK